MENILLTEKKTSGDKAPKPEKPSFPDKLKEKAAALWRDDRRFSERLITSGAAVLAFVFTFFMFGPFELFISNMSYFVFSAKQLLPPIILFGIAVFAAATVLFALLRGKVFNAVISLVLGITVAGYI